MRFMADENVSRRVVERLRAKGFDVVLIAGPLSGIPDREVFKLAEAEGCILITEDRHFGELAVRQRLGWEGLILLELDRLSNEAEAERVVEVITVQFERLAGNLTVIEPGRTRMRPLPRESE
jgi:predicted nuclease of predicted toxin-antitoxin system